MRPSWQTSLGAALAPWAGTPYRYGASRPGVGTDCFGFIGRVLDRLCGIPGTAPLPSLPPRGFWYHAPELAVPVFRAARRRWALTRLRGAQPEPGDVIWGRRPGSPVHTYMIGPGGEAWSCARAVGYGPAGDISIIRHYRPSGREQWSA